MIALRHGRLPNVSVTICPSATKSALRGEVRRHASPMVRPGAGSREAQQLDALVAHLDIDRDAAAPA